MIDFQTIIYYYLHKNLHFQIEFLGLVVTHN